MNRQRLRAWLTSALARPRSRCRFARRPSSRTRSGQSSRPRSTTSSRTNRPQQPIEDIRDETGRVVSRQSAPRRFILSYQVSVAVADAAIEHLLLGRIIKGASTTTQLPADELPDACARLAYRALQVAKPRTAGAPVSDALRVGDGVGAPRSISHGVRSSRPITEIAPPAEISTSVSAARGATASPLLLRPPTKHAAPPSKTASGPLSAAANRPRELTPRVLRRRNAPTGKLVVEKTHRDLQHGSFEHGRESL